MMSVATNSALSFSCVGVNIDIHCDDSEFREVLSGNFEGLPKDSPGAGTVKYSIRPDNSQSKFVISRHDSDFHREFETAGELVYLLEGDLVVQLQLLRPDLLFLHSAVVSIDDRAHLLVGRSGAGKSPTCWALLHHGFRYLSDELGPISIGQGTVVPYSHALCMKTLPPAEYPIPENSCITDRGCHISPTLMPTDPIAETLPVHSIFFVEYQSNLAKSSITPISHAEAATRLYSNVLNSLAHENDGLDAVLKLTEHVPCFRIDAGPLAGTCELIGDAVRSSGQRK